MPLLFSYSAGNNRKWQGLSLNPKSLAPFHADFSSYTRSSHGRNILQHIKI